MKPHEAAQIRFAAGKAYEGTLTAFSKAVAAIYGASTDEELDNLAPLIAKLWQLCEFDQVFYELGSVGFKGLIKEGWNPTIRGEDL